MEIDNHHGCYKSFKKKCICSSCVFECSNCKKEGRISNSECSGFGKQYCNTHVEEGSYCLIGVGYD